jgi:phosphoribosylanthranilate isomerase
VSNHLRIKICGITNIPDARGAARLGVDAIGLNFHRPSPRYVTPEVARYIMRALPPFVEPVGVFTDPDYEPLEELRLRYFQWHGELDALPPFMPEALSIIRLIVAFRIHDSASIDQMKRWLTEAISAGRMPAAVLVDSSVSGQYGGTGMTAPWDMLTDLKLGVPLILAGGLTPENVAEAVRIVRPYGVDVASGVESSPGRKDLEKMKRFIDNARSAAG